MVCFLPCGNCKIDRYNAGSIRPAGQQVTQLSTTKSTRNHRQVSGNGQIGGSVPEVAVGLKQPDRRSERTRRLIADAFVALLREKLYSQITVQDIINRANVGRSTFYAHYQDKADLLAAGFQGALEHLQQEIDLGREDNPLELPTTGLFAHMQQVQFIMRAFALDERTDLLFRHVHASLTAVFEKYLTALHPDQEQPSIPVAVIAHSLAGAYLSLARWWFDNNLPYTPERMDEIFEELAGRIIYPQDSKQ
jgi:AcrR family transcriptional regulator